MPDIFRGIQMCQAPAFGVVNRGVFDDRAQRGILADMAFQGDAEMGQRFKLILPIMLVPFSALAPARGDQHPISIDGEFADWAAVPVLYSDTMGDAPALSVDFRRIWVAEDLEFLFVCFETTIDIDLAESNTLRLYIDSDANASTGLAAAGLGAELEWHFGARAGTFYYPGGTAALSHRDLRFRAEPTITGGDFEFAIARDAMPDGVHALFSGNTIRLALIDNAGGDHIPESGESLTYAFDQGTPTPTNVIPLERRGPCDLRVVSQNVLFDSLFQPAQQVQFHRIFSTITPDIVLFQEIYSNPPQVTAALFDGWFPLPQGQTWQCVDVADCQIVSRFPILSFWPLDGNVAALIDTSTHWGRQMLAVSAHPPCCASDSARQAEIDRIMSFVRDAKQAGGTVTVPSGTPLLIGGDLNLVGLAQQLRTLLTGDIVNSQFGPDFSPDWDESSLTSQLPRHSEKRMGFTWRDDAQTFWPGHLDYLIYSDSVVRTTNSFVLITSEMSPATLAHYGLEADDSTASDHLLFVADFRLGPQVAGDINDDGAIDLNDLAALLAHFGTGPLPPANPLDGDVDGDQDVDLSDLSVLLAAFGRACPGL